MTTTQTDAGRTELAKLLGDHFPQSAARNDYLWSMADIIMGRGYRKPRTITTPEELDALPEGSVLLDPDGDVGRKVLGGWTTTVMEDDGSMWLTSNQEDMELPAIVLYEPEAEVGA